jgi:hypothetical protein
MLHGRQKFKRIREMTPRHGTPGGVRVLYSCAVYKHCTPKGVKPHELQK